ncbi:outer membrane beta-barrel protein [Helicobacter ailurogastricus]|uniref:outer membrane beta-barrel protein n=1 Tax=Helicobacter ailurogastricus TaxID=1578720 RepID=UPI002554A67B|nr:outer membrane beta-barrel protein [Helicobacter ailurogastricus]
MDFSVKGGGRIGFLSSVALLLFSPLLAEKNGFFMGGGFIYNHFTRNLDFTIPTDGTHTLDPVPDESATHSQQHGGALYGGEIMLGYKQFFGKPRLFGLRYFAFANGMDGGYNYLTFDRHAQMTSATQNAATFFYGAGIDILSNFYDRGDHSLGVFVGGMIGGQSWLLGRAYAAKLCQTQIPSQPKDCVSADVVWKNNAAIANSMGNDAKFYEMPSFQVAVQGGFRVQLSKHQSFEVGVRFPFLEHTYYTEEDKNKWGIYGKNGKARIFLKRGIALFAHYFYTF